MGFKVRGFFCFVVFFCSTVFGQFHIVGYFPTWSGDVSQIQYDKLTCINYSFILPSDGSGNLTSVNGSRLSDLVTRAHAQDVKVCIAVGGWNDGNDGNFETLAANPPSRTAFVNNLVDFVNTYNLDGVDIDWEYPDQGASADNYSALMQELGEELHGLGKILTSAVIGSGDWAGLAIQEEVFGYVDYLNIMSYDHGGQNHSSWDNAVDDLNYWLDRGLPREKAVLGVPFYGRGDDQYVSYRDLVAQDSEAPWKNNVGNIYYNGIPLIQDKTQLALDNGGGIMFWELSQDTHDETSLLSAIYEVADQYETSADNFALSGVHDCCMRVGESEGRVFFSLASMDNVCLKIYDLMGRQVYETAGRYEAGAHSVNIGNVSTKGAYVAALKTSLGEEMVSFVSVR